jgi:hypothetical protein
MLKNIKTCSTPPYCQVVQGSRSSIPSLDFGIGKNPVLEKMAIVIR